MKTCPAAPAGDAAISSAARSARLDPDRRELPRIVRVERKLLLDEAVLEQGLLHHAERLDVDAPVDRQERARDLVRAEDGLRAPAELLGHERRRLLRVVAHQLERAEEGPLALADRLGLLGDRVLG